MAAASPWTRTSPPEYRLVLSPKAEQDIEDILFYTGERWGEKQIPVYRDKLASALEALRSNLAIGHTHADLPGTHRVYPVGWHVIVYRVQDGAIGVFRILHKRMSLPHYA